MTRCDKLQDVASSDHEFQRASGVINEAQFGLYFGVHRDKAIFAGLILLLQ